MSKISFDEGRETINALYDVLGGDDGSACLAALKTFIREEPWKASEKLLDVDSVIVPLLRARKAAPPEPNIIDLDTGPFCPDGWFPAEHLKGGQFLWNPDKVELFLSEEQKKGGMIAGYDLQKIVMTETPFNANMLDWLLLHPEFIPKAWKDFAVFFWGTTYRSVYTDKKFVRYLFWFGDKWDWSSSGFSYPWYSPFPAAVLRQGLP